MRYERYDVGENSKPKEDVEQPKQDQDNGYRLEPCCEYSIVHIRGPHATNRGAEYLKPSSIVMLVMVLSYGSCDIATSAQTKATKVRN